MGNQRMPTLAGLAYLTHRYSTGGVSYPLGGDAL